MKQAKKYKERLLFLNLYVFNLDSGDFQWKKWLAYPYNLKKKKIKTLINILIPHFRNEYIHNIIRIIAFISYQILVNRCEMLLTLKYCINFEYLAVGRSTYYHAEVDWFWLNSPWVAAVFHWRALQIMRYIFALTKNLFTTKKIT